jgi:hypothetical protein
MSIWEQANAYGLTGFIDPGGIGGLGYQIEAIDRASSSFSNMHFVFFVKKINRTFSRTMRLKRFNGIAKGEI